MSFHLPPASKSKPTSLPVSSLSSDKSEWQRNVFHLAAVPDPRQQSQGLFVTSPALIAFSPLLLYPALPFCIYSIYFFWFPPHTSKGYEKNPGILRNCLQIQLFSTIRGFSWQFHPRNGSMCVPLPIKWDVAKLLYPGNLSELSQRGSLPLLNYSKEE